MPRKAKDVNVLDSELIENVEKTTKEKVVKEKVDNTKKSIKKTTETKTTKDKNTHKSTTKKIKETTSKTTKTKKVTSTKLTEEKSKLKEKSKAKTSISKTHKRTIKPTVEVLEYYDLPYRYNETVVKLLAQTPTSLFVYWDISDADKENYIKEYGEYFFNNTKPVLLVTNETMNYSFEVDINDFANCWYLHVNDSKCIYKITLGRRPINQYIEIPNNYLYITDSNSLESPNNHILIDSLSHSVFFKNVKNDTVIEKEINSFSFMQRIGKLYNIYNLYQELYGDEDIIDLDNPSSGNPTSRF